ncbi:UDP-glucose 4-epimerase-like protein [Streptomyces subrutilus]|uniref:NAD-dependent epimerase/dehydratase family protein n=1 Tax=Streptomyces subrutilus TaxID=36818 RepID=A0A5P2UF84_9ACTN|nr:NAD-dependent epimerase/dehydratase family protein [Streptomyces subrutilus]QEU77109.1 NAD-dependent epimerase/dehydratase family protein [Streptomyces subrutilus]GGZ86648.1 UDP-glucose 4-epimerase-like protein [Streptomyces subrutilus]
MKIVITGGAGFIGSNLAHALAQRAEVSDIRVVDDLSTGSKDNLVGAGVHLVEGSVLDGPLLDRAFRGADVIVHLAAVPSVSRSVADPLTSHHANATGTLMVLEAARRAGDVHVIAASSSSVYGANTHLPKHEELRPAPLSPYAVGKLAAESYLAAYHHCYELPVLPFRFFNVYGPRQPAGHDYAAVVPAWINAVTTGQQVLVHGDGLQSRDFTYVETVCRVLAEAVLRKVVSADPVNLAYGTRTSLGELITELEAVLGTPIEPRHLPPRPGDVRHSHAENSRLRSLFPAVEPVPLREGLERTVEWFRAQAR